MMKRTRIFDFAPPAEPKTRSNLFSITGVVTAAVLVFLGAITTARASVIVPALTMTGFATTDSPPGGDPNDYSLGYTFATTQTLTITALGTLDIGGDTIATASGPVPVKLYYSAIPPDSISTVDGGQTSGTQVPGASVFVTGSSPILAITGGAYTSGDGFRYTDLSSPIVLPAGTYEIVSSTLGMRPQFKYNATGLAEVDGIGTAPANAYKIGDTTAGYAPNNFPGNPGGDYGPNFLVSVPEPSTAALLAFGPMLLMTRRRTAGHSDSMETNRLE